MYYTAQESKWMKQLTSVFLGEAQRGSDSEHVAVKAPLSDQNAHICTPNQQVRVCLVAFSSQHSCSLFMHAQLNTPLHACSLHACF